MILVFDTETTGLPKNYKAPITDSENWPRLVQIAWRIYQNDGVLIDCTQYVIYPQDFDIPDDAAKLHGITTERAREEGISLKSAMLAFELDLIKADFVVAHNIAYDEKIVGAEFLRSGMANSFEGKQTICTMLASVNFCAIPGPRGNKWPKLGELYQNLFAENLEGQHDAVVDCEAAARCFWGLMDNGVIVLKWKSDPVDEMFPVMEAQIMPEDEKEIPISDDLREALGMEGVKVVEMTDEETSAAIDEVKADIDSVTKQRIAFDASYRVKMTDEQVADFLADFQKDDGEINSPIILQRMIVNAYEELSRTRQLFVRAGNRTAYANGLLETRKNEAITKGEITGSNDTQRKAQLVALTIEESELVSKCEQEEREARFEFDQAQADVEMVRALLRVAELANGGRTGER